MSRASSAPAFERSIRRYSWYTVLSGAHFWMPVFILYFSTIVSLREIFLLESIYYGTVFVLEVPSGYFSDRLGRKLTLLISVLAFCASYALFIVGGSFAVLALAQVLLASGFAFASGTDTSLHYALLTASGREGEYGSRESVLAARTLVASAMAAVVGGLFAWLGEYRLAYVLAFATSLGALVLVAVTVDPESSELQAHRSTPLSQLRGVVGALRTKPVGYLFAFIVVMTVLNHVPYEFYQLYIRSFVEDISRSREGFGEITPLVTGFHLTATMLVAALCARFATAVGKRTGTKGILLLIAVLQLGIITVLTVPGRLVIVLLLLLRSVPAAVMNPVTRAEIAPAIATTLRATYFSVQSLAGRLAFALTLVAFHFVPGDGYRSSLLFALTLGITAFVALTVILYRTGRNDDGPKRPTRRSLP